MIEIKEYEEKYAKEISDIIVQNLLEVNIKDYSMEYVKNTAEEFTEEEIKKAFPKRTKAFMAMDKGEVVGTASYDKSWYNDDGEYYILTVFIKPSHHKQGIGKILIQEIEKHAKQISAKKLVIMSSITGCEFYRKLGYEYKGGKKELNEKGMYTMVKNFIKEKEWER